MTVETHAAPVQPLVEKNAAFPSEPWESQTVHVSASWGRSGAVICARGEIDASNADTFADYVQRCVNYCEWLAVDLTDLDFLGTSGFSALHRINTQCAVVDVQWALVPGPAVSRLLQLCDPDCALPTAESVGVALAKVQADPRRLP